MFRTFFRFEISYWLRGFMVYVFLCVNALLIFGATISDNVRVGNALENTTRNAPHVIQTFYASMGLICCLMTVAFVNSAATRDFAYQTSGLIFSKPIGRLSYLIGRFWGSAIISALPMLGISLGVIFAGLVAMVVPDTIPTAGDRFPSARICGDSLSSVFPMPSFLRRSSLLWRPGFEVPWSPFWP